MTGRPTTGGRRAVRLTLLCLLAVAVVAAGTGCGDTAETSTGGPSIAPPTGFPDDSVATSQAPPASTETDPPAAPAVVNPCDLVTQQEAEQLAGTPLDAPQQVEATCTFTSPPSGPTAQVEVFVGPGAKKILDINRELGHEFRELPGVGDEAYAEDDSVYVNISGQWVSIRLVRLNDPAENRQPLEDLARVVAGRL
ncbi:DUF3558 family protein [Solwaraspora sp. WMMA2065]|uniref:DUF3558 family protein n=1 Tax=Solwaraspora sp. WMMA2065 TaxID=3015166 RepID=UPI00259B9055|nr:DUF3558 family protein [Solwaraspora sp. WMMA2065]WJK33583.1 DUF3558 family protein [Solwaraspora sp. WMMA2065]